MPTITTNRPTTTLSLVKSAENGCDLCVFIRHEFKNYKTKMAPILCDTMYILNAEDAICEKRDQGQPTDIRVRIDSSYHFGSDDPKTITLLDALLVQAGDEEESMLPLKFGLSMPREPPAILGRFRIGRSQTNPDLASDENFTIARGWLDECCNQHKNHPKYQATQLPTRVVDVGEAGSSSAPYLLNSGGQMGAYVALSHCWGGDMPIKLLTSNIKQFSSSISMVDLAANFQDAIYIARKLCDRYIWIDSLCIIQDSRLDWEIESKTMGTVYQNALLTSAAAASERSTEGILKTYKSNEEESETVVALKLRPSSPASDIVRLSWRDEKEESLWDIFHRGTLASRGWTLQERILSQRVLFYGRRQIYWQCRQGFKSADGVPEGNLTPAFGGYPGLSQLLAKGCGVDDDGLRVQQIYSDWYDMICEYNVKALTYGSDKFPAVAGLAAKVSDLINDRYIAGLWQGDICRGLLWYREMDKAVPFQPYRAPSWSWAATNDPILFLNGQEAMTASPHDAKLKGYHIDPAGQSGFAEVESGWLLLHGLTGRLIRSKQIISSQAPTNIYGIAYFDQAEPEDAKNTSESLTPVLIDDKQFALLAIRTSYAGPCKWEVDKQLIYSQEYRMLLLAFSTFDSPSVDDGGVTSVDVDRVMRTHALILSLEPDTKNAYRRAGYLHFDLWPVDMESWASRWTWQDVMLI